MYRYEMRGKRESVGNRFSERQLASIQHISSDERKMKMKYLVLIPDGAADYPIEALGKKTPLEAADKPTLDRLAKNSLGRNRFKRTVRYGSGKRYRKPCHSLI